MQSQQQQAAGSSPDRCKLFMQGFPAGTTEEKLKEVFSEYGKVTFIKVLPPHPTKSDVACLVRMGSPEEAKWLVDNMDRQIPKGLTSPCFVQYSTSTVQGPEVKLENDVRPAASSAPPDLFPPSEKLWMKGLPPGATEESLAKIFNAYGTVTFCKLLRPPHPDMSDSACLIRMSSMQEAQFLREQMDGHVPEGLTQPVTIRYAANNERFDSAHKQVALDPAQQDNVYMKGWPEGATEEQIKQVCAMCGGAALSCKILPAPSPNVNDIACLVRMGSAEQAKALIDNMDGKTPPGMTEPITVRLAANIGKPFLDKRPLPPRGSCFNCGEPGHHAVDCTKERRFPPAAELARPALERPARPPSEHLYVKGLPVDITEQTLKMIFGAYGCIVTSCKILSPPDPTLTDAACLLKMGSIDEAKFMVEILDKQIPVGLDQPIVVRFADKDRPGTRFQDGAKGKAKGKGKSTFADNRYSPYGPPTTKGGSDWGEWWNWSERPDWHAGVPRPPGPASGGPSPMEAEVSSSEPAAAPAPAAAAEQAPPPSVVPAPPPPTATAPTTVPSEPTTQICKWYVMGDCWKGANCKYSHDLSSSQKPWQSWRGSAWQYSHDGQEWEGEAADSPASASASASASPAPAQALAPASSPASAGLASSGQAGVHPGNSTAAAMDVDQTAGGQSWAPPSWEHPGGKAPGAAGPAKRERLPVVVPRRIMAPRQA